MLDVILTDDDYVITSVKSCPPVGYSDHIAIEFTLTPTHVENLDSRSPCGPVIIPGTLVITKI